MKTNYINSGNKKPNVIAMNKKAISGASQSIRMMKQQKDLAKSLSKSPGGAKSARTTKKKPDRPNTVMMNTNEMNMF